MNIQSILILGAIIIIVALIIYKEFKNRKNGGGCSCGCSTCAAKDSCKSKNK